MPRELTVPVSSRVSPEVKRMIELASDVEEVSVSQFLAEAGEEAAVRAIVRRGVSTPDREESRS